MIEFLTAYPALGAALSGIVGAILLPVLWTVFCEIQIRCGDESYMQSVGCEGPVFALVGFFGGIILFVMLI